MRILYLTTHLGRGGATDSILSCAQELARQGHEITLVTGADACDPVPRIDPQVCVLILPSLCRHIDPWRDLHTFLALHRLASGYDLVNTHMFKTGLLGRWAAWLRGVPAIVHTYRGALPSRRLFAWLERLTAHISHRLIVSTPNLVDDFVRAGIPRERLAVVISGVDLSAFPARPACPNNSSPVVGTLTRLVPVKGLADLLEAFRHVVRERPDCRLLIVGDGPLRAELESRVKALGLSQHVSLPGHVENPVEVLHQLDLFVLSSRSEGASRATIEAMACGLPILATRVGGLVDLVQQGRNGLLVEPGQPEALARGLLDLLSDRERLARMGRESVQLAQAFSQERMYAQLRAVYQTLPGQEKSPRRGPLTSEP